MVSAMALICSTAPDTIRGRLALAEPAAMATLHACRFCGRGDLLRFMTSYDT